MTASSPGSSFLTSVDATDGAANLNRGNNVPSK